VQYYINICTGKKKLKKHDINAQDYESIDKDDETGLNFKEKNFRRKIAIIFPFLKELKRPELEELHEAIIHESAKKDDPEICLPNTNDLTNENNDYVYLVKEGMFEILSDSNRTVEYMSNNDIFGLVPLIAKDVRMKAKPRADTKYYKVRSEILLKFMDKYPYLQKTLYSYGIEIYLKCCLSSHSRTKTSYFRRLRRLSSTYLTDLFESGSVKKFEDSKMMLDYFYEEHLSSVGVFALKGRFNVVHQDPNIAKVQQLFKLEELDLIRDFLKNRSSFKKLGNYNTDDPRDRLTDNFYSIKRKNDDYFDSDDNILKSVEIEPGNAVEIHPDFLEKIEFLDSEILIFVIEAKVGKTSDEHQMNIFGSLKKFSNIKRKKKH
jgi:CRP-like cAMP-binding protein